MKDRQRSPDDLLTERELAMLEQFAGLCDAFASLAGQARSVRTRGDAAATMNAFDRAVEAMDRAEFVR